MNKPSSIASVNMDRLRSEEMVISQDPSVLDGNFMPTSAGQMQIVNRGVINDFKPPRVPQVQASLTAGLAR